MVCLHGFTGTWRTWELVLAALERRHDVFAPTLPGHTGGPPLPEKFTTKQLVDSVESVLDAAGIGIAHLVGNSVGGYLALQLAARGRALSVVALAPAGGWAANDASVGETLEMFALWQQLFATMAPRADAIVATPDGRRRATQAMCERCDHIPRELLVHQLLGTAACPGLRPMIDTALREGYDLDAARVQCPVRIVWGTADRILRWPSSAARYRYDWLPHADWVELDGVGHCPQLDDPLLTAQLILGLTAP